MAISDLFETHHFNYEEDSSPLESDDEDELSFTPIPDHSILALRLIRDHLPDEVTHWEGTIYSGFRFQYQLLDLHIESGGYSCRLSPRFTVYRKGLGQELCLDLETELKRIEKEDVEAQRFNRRPLDSFHFATLVLRMVEAASAHVIISEAQNIQLGHHYDLDSVPNTAQDYLGVTPRQICNDILPGYRVVHVESIIRRDLARKFTEFQDQLRSKLIHRPLNELLRFVPPENRPRGGGSLKSDPKHVAYIQELIDYIVTPKLTFHGTQPELVPSIVQYGFLKPGSVHPATGVPLPVRCGSTYGRGIYSSPSSAFSLAYSGSQGLATKPGGIPGLKLLVCATIMGRHVNMYRNDNWREQSKPYPESDSHIANDGQEYIVFNNAQILPCYVVHLNWANSSEADDFVSRKLGRSSSKRPWLGTEVSCPGDLQRLKKERLAQDIADVDDDEEEYGEYQADRLDDVKDVDIWSFRLEGETEKDEYSYERKARRERMGSQWLSD
ncbi:hypothetical protein BDP27DRAFT_14571 [Rhodocollybia butyracea]|uniref:PARP catalytic domain-containing protein n=1 Tax=Rhodocollybia butyracea TaxID=206335 RepID=A0A9P5Q5K4_9AGAR|nr:hypothetical protein BDP27DRAFT_14571 [Rhodocollybia butyracea]